MNLLPHTCLTTQLPIRSSLGSPQGLPPSGELLFGACFCLEDKDPFLLILIFIPSSFQVHWTLPPPTCRRKPSPRLHRSLSNPVALSSSSPLVLLASLLLPHPCLIICSPPVHPLSPFLPSCPTSPIITLRLLFGQTSILPIRLPGTLPGTGPSRDLLALPGAGQRDLLQRVQPALLPGLLLLTQAGLGAQSVKNPVPAIYCAIYCAGHILKD